MAKAIALITPNQDTFTNPILEGVIKKFHDEGYKVLIFCPEQAVSSVLETVIEKHFLPLPFLHRPKTLSEAYRTFISYWRVARMLRKNKVKHLLAVDPMGVILGGRIKKLFPQVKYYYFSFEIFFLDEIKKEDYFYILKQKEIKYSKNASAIIIQDEKRKELLEQENRLINMKWLFIPVSPGKNLLKPGNSNSDLKQPGKKVIIHSGSVEYWSGAQIIIDSLKIGIPENYLILIHNRYPFNMDNPIHKRLTELVEDGYPLVLHDEVFEDYSEYCNFLQNADYGLALYCSFDNPYTGKNIKEIGLASGKFATYMMMGLPTITTISDTFLKLNDKYAYGCNINSAEELVNVLKTGQLDSLNPGNCKKLYSEVLEPSASINSFFDHIQLAS